MTGRRLTFTEAICQIDKLFKSGDLVQEDGQLLGLTATGEVVVIEADMARPTAARDVTRYIADHPTPDTWIKGGE